VTPWWILLGSCVVAFGSWNPLVGLLKYNCIRPTYYVLWLVIGLDSFGAV